MDENHEVSTLLTRAATLIGEDVGTAPTEASFAVRRRARRRHAAGVAAAMVFVLALAVGLTAVTRDRHSNSPSVAVGPFVTAGSGLTVSQLAQGHWSTQPGSPIQSRIGPAYAWTGSQLLIWGGADETGTFSVHNDGAVYTPATRTWSMMPPAPLTARANTTFVWTGRYLLVWAGVDTSTGGRATDGALYDPATKTWRRLPPVGATDSAVTQTVWTGTQVVLITAKDHGDSTVVHAHTYNPSTNRWRTLPDLQLATHHGVGGLLTLSTGSSVYLWASWLHTVAQGNGSSTSFGVDQRQLDIASEHWSAAQLTPGTQPPRAPVWTGHEVIVPSTNPWCGLCKGLIQRAAPGAVINPLTGVIETITASPLADVNPTYQWTGRALLAFNGGAQAGNSDRGRPGSTAAWDPTTGHWTDLPHAPYATYGDAIEVWTGSSLLIWGALVPSGNNHAKPTTMTMQFSR